MTGCTRTPVNYSGVISSTWLWSLVNLSWYKPIVQPPLWLFENIDNHLTCLGRETWMLSVTAAHFTTILVGSHDPIDTRFPIRSFCCSSALSSSKDLVAEKCAGNRFLSSPLYFWSVSPVVQCSHGTRGLERLGYSEHIIWLCETECQRNQRNAAFPHQQLRWWRWVWRHCDTDTLIPD